MKPAVAITLIIAGTLVVLAPVISNYLYQGRVVEFSNGNQGNVSIYALENTRLGNGYAFACYALGGVMIIIAIAGSRRFRSADSG